MTTMYIIRFRDGKRLINFRGFDDHDGILLNPGEQFTPDIPYVMTRWMPLDKTYAEWNEEHYYEELYKDWIAPLEKTP